MKLGEIAEKFLNKKELSVQGNTIRRYRSHYRNHLSYLDDKEIDEISVDLLQELVFELNEKLEPRTIESIFMNVLHQVFQEAMKRDLVNKNPVDLVELPSSDNSEFYILEGEKREEFLDYVQRWSSISPVYTLALHTGMRRGEILGLKWDMVDIQKKRIKVRRQIVKNVRSKPTLVNRTKTPSSRRCIEISQEMSGRLQDVRQRKNSEFVVSDPDDDGFVTPTKLYYRFNKICEKLDLEEMNFHDLRHTHATDCLKKNIHPKIVQERLGHADIQTTMNTYSHVMPTMQRKAVEKLGDHTGEMV